MTVLNFPSPSASPYEVNGVRYTWDGEAWVAAGGGDTYLKVEGGNITGPITSVENQISGSWDLSDGPFFRFDGGTVPAFTNAVAGASGLIRVTAAIDGWTGNVVPLDVTLPSPTSFPSIVPYYVQNTGTVLLGTAQFAG